MSLVYTNSDSNLIISAAGFAKAAHQGQFRNTLLAGSNVSVPYIVHVARVAGLVCTLPDVTEEMVAAAWLHDVIEDCGVKPHIIGYLFGETVEEYTVGLTSWNKREENIISCKTMNRGERISKNNIQTGTECLEVRRIKICDRIDNMTDTLIEADQSFALRYAMETEHLISTSFLTIPDNDLRERLISIVEAVKNKYKEPILIT